MTISPRKRRLLRRAAIATAVVCGSTYLLLNEVTRWILIQQIRQVSGLDVEIDSVRITPTSAVARGIRLRDGSSDQAPLLTVAEVNAHLTLFDAVTSGKFADDVTVIAPSVQLEYSETGDLLTTLPTFAGGGGETAIPLRRLNICEAEIHVRQHGGRRFELNGVAVVVRCEGLLEFTAAAPQLLGGNWRLQGQLHPKTLAGSATLAGDSIRIRGDDIRQWPLIVNAAEIPGDAEVTGSISVTVESPANIADVRDCAADLRLTLLSLNIPAVGVQAATGFARIRQRNGRVNVDADGSILGGHVSLNGEVDVRAELPGGQLRWIAQGLQLNSVAQRWNVPAQGILNLSGSIAASGSTEQIQFDSSLRSNISKISVCGITVDPLHSSVAANGAFTVADGKIALSHGEKQFEAQSQGCQLEQLVPQLARMVTSGRQTSTASDVNLLLQKLRPHGRASFVAEARAPLTAFLHPEQITGTARVVWAGVSSGEFRIEDGIAALHVAAGNAAMNLRNARIFHAPSGRTSTINFEAGAPLHPEGMARAEFRMTDFPLALPGSLWGLQADSCGGDLSAAAIVQVPLNRLGDATAYSGQGHVRAPRIVATGQDISNAQLEWMLGNGRFSVVQFGAQAAAVAMQGNAHLNLVSPYRFAGICTVGAAELATLSHAVSRHTNTDVHVVGAVGINCVAEGELASKRFSLDGNLLLQHFAVRNGQPGTLNLNWRLIPESLTVESSHGGFCGGDMTMTASLNSRARVTALTGKFQQVQMPTLNGLLGIATKCDGALGGSFSFTDPLIPGQVNGAATLASPQINVLGLSIESLQTSVLAESGVLRASVNATIAGSPCDATLRTDIPSMLSLTAESFSRPDQLPIEMDARLTQMSLARIRGPLQQMTGLKLPVELTGTVDGSVIRTADTARAGQLATGEVSLKAVGWNRRVVASQLVARLHIKPRLLEVHDISGTLAEGRVNGRAVLNLNEPPDGTFRVAVSGINLTKAALPFVKDARRIQGRASLRVDGRIARRM